MNDHKSDWKEHDRRVRPYLWAHRGIGAAHFVFGVALLGVALAGGAVPGLERALAPAAGRGFLLWAALFGSLALAWQAVSFPFAAAHWKVERHFGLSRQGFGSWTWDVAKGLLVGLAVGLPALGAFYASVRLFPEAWGAAAATFVVLFSILLAQLAPVVLVPLFFKLKPLEPGPLKERLLELARKFGVEVGDVYHIGLGQKTEKANAAFLGLGRTKRIVIGDTLYGRFPADEVVAVFGHELGHQVRGDLVRGILFSAAVTYAAFGAAQSLAERVVLSRAGVSAAEPYGFFLFLVVLGLVGAPLGVAGGIFSRARERGADAFAAERLGLAGPLADALERLTVQNFGLFRPHPVVEFLAYSHPAPARRILALRALAAETPRHGDERS